MLLDALFSSRCAGCQEAGAQLCRRCRFTLAAAPSVRVAGPADLAVRAALPYDGLARQLVIGLKYRNRRAMANVLAAQLVSRLGVSEVDLVTWAPTSQRRAGERGFDQAELIARSVARQIGVPCQRVLYRVHGGRAEQAQTGRSRVERLLGPTFRARPVPAGLHVLVVDDVVTTGATLRAAGRALLDGGIAEVSLVAVAAARATAEQRRVELRRAS